jgi:phosphodiesterase/alkaline phosphatase D-like protein
VSDTGAAPAGSSTINVVGTAGALNHQDSVALTLYTAGPSAAALTAPADGTTGVALAPTFTWTDATNETGYTLEIATDPDFATIVHTAALAANSTSYNGATLSPDTVYYWRIGAGNVCGTENSATRAFRTAAVPACTELLLEPGFEGGPTSA